MWTVIGDVILFGAGALFGWAFPKVVAQIVAWTKSGAKKVKKASKKR